MFRVELDKGEYIPQRRCEYPRLAIHQHTRLVVVFTSEGVGTVIAAGATGHTIGETKTDWFEANFHIVEAGESLVFHNTWEEVDARI